MDEIWYIYVSEDERRKRLLQEAILMEKISDIFKSQLSDAEFRKHADKVINNGADIEKTRAQLEIILGI